MMFDSSNGLNTLDHACLLKNIQLAQTYRQALAAYRQAPFRSPALAGRSYPADAGQLWRFLQMYLDSAATVPPLTPDWSQPVGLLSPHIDYPRGGRVYAQVWQRAAQVAQEADLVVIFGTDHYGIDPFTLTRQNYATPYGLLPTAQPIVDALVAVIGEEVAFAGELRHCGEHSLELVLVWLHHMRQGLPVPVVPILVGSLQPFLGNGTTPAQAPLLQQVLETLRVHTQGRRVLVIASGDLAHVGPAFHGPPLDPIGRRLINAADQALITYMEQGDAEKFLAAIQQVGDRNNVCGVVPIYLALHALGRVQGEPCGYATCPADPAGTSVVTICGMIFR